MSLTARPTKIKTTRNEQYCKLTTGLVQKNCDRWQDKITLRKANVAPRDAPRCNSQGCRFSVTFKMSKVAVVSSALKLFLIVWPLLYCWIQELERKLFARVETVTYSSIIGCEISGVFGSCFTRRGICKFSLIMAATVSKFLSLFFTRILFTFWKTPLDGMGQIVLSTCMLYFNRIVDVWNMLPLSIRYASSISGFKKGVRDYLKCLWSKKIIAGYVEIDYFGFGFTLNNTQ